MYLKTLTLDYDYFDNEIFELSVINDNLIELYHPESGTYYEFRGRGYIQYLEAIDTATGKSTSSTEKLRTQKTEKTENPRINKRL
jgi:hypothetical protein